MFDIGFWELSIIGVVALVVIGPERLPAVARTAGKWVGKANRLISSVKDDIAKEMDNEELKKILEEQQKLAQDFKQAAEDTSASINQFDANEILAIDELEESSKKKKSKSKKKKNKKKKLKADKLSQKSNDLTETTNSDTPAVTKLNFDNDSHTENELISDKKSDQITDIKNTSSIDINTDSTTSIIDKSETNNLIEPSDNSLNSIVEQSPETEKVNA